MKNLKLRKLVAVALAVMTIATVSPIGASAAWKQDSRGWWNTEGSSWSIGWRNINGSWYDFGSDGYMKTGWINDGGTWYYAAPSGEMKTGWVNDGGKWYYTASSGAMQTGWVNDGGTWYFTASSGAMQTGVVEVDGKTYYLAPSGAMAIGAVTIDGVTYTFAPSGEAIGDKIPTATVAFASTGITVTPSKTTADTTTADTTTADTTTSGGGGSSSSSNSSSNNSSSGGTTGVTYRDITPLVSDIYNKNLASKLANHATLDSNISVSADDSAIVVTLEDDKLNSLSAVFENAQNQELSLIEARLDKAEKIMNSSSAMLNVDGGSFTKYLAQEEKANIGKSVYFNDDGSFNKTDMAKKISDKTLTYDKFKEDLIAMCSKTEKAPRVSISYGGMSETVTKIERNGITIYDTGSSIYKNINGLVDLGDTTTGIYKVYCRTNYFTVKVTK